MTRTTLLAQLFRALAANDNDAAKQVAKELYQFEDKKGFNAVAKQLRQALTSSSPERGTIATPRGASIAGPEGTVFSTALTQLKRQAKLSDVVLVPSVRDELKKVILEWRYRSRLVSKGLFPRSKLILHGPPGCGKSMTASALGAELELPVYMVRFDAVIGAFLGQTAIHLRQVFRFAELTPCVLLLDELDALGKKRGNPLDVGELDRIVISLMQELEHSRPAGIVVGTTNLASNLDEALWRRFDLALELRQPSSKTLRSFAERLSAERKLKLPSAVLTKAAHSKNFAAAEQVVQNAMREQVLRGLA